MGQFWNDLLAVLLGTNIFGMVCMQIVSQSLSRRSFVPSLVFKANSKCLQPLCAILLQQGGEQGTVVAPTEEHPHRHISHHTILKSRAQNLLHLRFRLIVSNIQKRLLIIVKHIPIGGCRTSLAGNTVSHDVARHEFISMLKDRNRCRHIAILKIKGNSLFRNLLPESRMMIESLYLAGKHKDAVSQIVVEGLHARSVTCEKQLLLLPVKDGKGKHTDEPVDASFAPLLESMQDDLSIRLVQEYVPRSYQFVSDFLKIVDLAIEHNGIVQILHRLIGIVRQVDDGKTGMPQKAMTVRIHSHRLVVWATMLQRHHHLRAYLLTELTAYIATDTTHTPTTLLLTLQLANGCHKTKK